MRPKSSNIPLRKGGVLVGNNTTKAGREVALAQKSVTSVWAANKMTNVSLKH